MLECDASCFCGEDGEGVVWGDGDDAKPSARRMPFAEPFLDGSTWPEPVAVSCQAGGSASAL